MHSGCCHGQSACGGLCCAQILQFSFAMPPAGEMAAMARWMTAVMAFIDAVGQYKLRPEQKVQEGCMPLLPPAPALSLPSTLQPTCSVIWRACVHVALDPEHRQSPRLPSCPSASPASQQLL